MVINFKFCDIIIFMWLFNFIIIYKIILKIHFFLKYYINIKSRKLKRIEYFDWKVTCEEKLRTSTLIWIMQQRSIFIVI